MASVAALLMFAILAGCAAAPPVESAVGREVQCSTESASALVGQPLTPAIRRKALEVTGSEMLRVLHPGDGATADYQTARLNIIVDARGIITELRCG